MSMLWPQSATQPTLDAREVIAANPVLSLLDERAREKLAQTLRPRQLAAGESLWEGSKADGFYLVGSEGRLRLESVEDPRLEDLYLSQGWVIGAWFFRNEPAIRWVPPVFHAKAVMPTVVYSARNEDLAALSRDATLWPDRDFEAFYELLETDTLLSISPDTYDLLGRQRLELSRMARPVPRQIPAGELLYGPTRSPEGLYFAMYGGLMGITRRDGRTGQITAQYEALPSHFFGVDSLYSHTEVVEARAVRDTWIWVIPRVSIEARMLAAHDRSWLNLAVGRWVEHNRLAPQLVQALLGTRLFGHYARYPSIAETGPSQSALYELLRAGRIRNWNVGAAPPPPVGAVSGFGIVLEGEILSYLPAGTDQMGDHIALGDGLRPRSAYGAMDVFGEDTMVVEASMERLGRVIVPNNCYRARTPSRVLFLPRELCDRLLSGQEPYGEGFVDVLADQWRAAALRKWMGLSRDFTSSAQPPPPLAQMLAEGVQAARRRETFIGVLIAEPTVRPTVVLLEELRQPSPDHEIEALGLACARAIHEGFGEESIVAVLQEGEGPGVRVALQDFDPEFGVRRAVITAPLSTEAIVGWLGTWTRTLLAKGQGPKWVLLVARGAMRTLQESLRGACDRVAFVAAVPDLPMPAHTPPTLAYTYLALLDWKPGARLPRHGTYPPGASRMRLPEAALAGWRPEAPASDLWERLQAPARDEAQAPSGRWQGIARFSRGVTDRRVGVALGGGGAWGMAHVAILRGLYRAGIPIDVLAGASVGTTVGSYYATLGLPGLDLLLKRRYALQAAAIAGLVTLEPFRMVVNKDLGGARLEDLELPFFPVATDLLCGSPTPILRGQIGQATRKSGSLPPLYSETNTRTGTYIDGGFSDNLPVDVLQVEGARLLVASDIIPPPPRRPPSPPRMRRLLGKNVSRFLSDLNVPRRFSAIARGSLTLFHTGGNTMGARAPIHFDSMWTGTLPENLGQGPQLIHDTLGSESFWMALQGAQVRWDYLKHRPYRPTL